MSESIYDLLKKNGMRGRMPMHMPGHKRNPVFSYLQSMSAAEDITEIDGFDNLHAAEGILAESMARAAQLFGSRHARFLVNGSSGGILAGIRALTRRGDTVIVSRNAHKSVYHALELCGLHPVFLIPPYDAASGMFVSMPKTQVERALEQHPEATLVILTSPTYEGVVSDVASIAETVHRHGARLFVDEAHGAHFSFSSGFPQSAVRCGADLVVQSLHKTLPSLTQTAILHVAGERVDVERLDHELAVFETSSPSYLLLASMDGCVRWMQKNPAMFSRWTENLDVLDAEIADCQHLVVPFHQSGRGIDGVYEYDRSKLFLSCTHLSVSGTELANRLRLSGVEPEMDSESGVLLMSGAGDTRATMERLGKILLALDREMEAGCRAPLWILPALPAVQMTTERALEQPWESVSMDACAGRVAAEYLWAYPPGIPYLAPGEIISEEFMHTISHPDIRARLHGTRTGRTQAIAVTAE